MNWETTTAIANILSGLITLILMIGVPILFGWLLYKAIIGIIREIKKKD